MKKKAKRNVFEFISGFILNIFRFSDNSMKGRSWTLLIILIRESILDIMELILQIY